MSGLTAKGQTVEEAVQAALNELGVTREQVEIRIIDEGKKGFLGFIGSRPAIVEVAVQTEPEVEAKAEPVIDPIEQTEAYLNSIFTEMNIEIGIEKQVKGRDVTFVLSGEQVALLIGKRGITLNSLQQLAQLVANKHAKQYINVMIDAEHYREKRKATLESLAQRLAKQVFHTKKRVVLEPMPSFERKIIHQALSHHPNVITTSEGNEPHRHVVISPK